MAEADDYDVDALLSLMAKIEQRLGAEVDPGITLEADDVDLPPTRPLGDPPSSGGAGAGPSSGLLERLRDRPVVGGRYRVDGEIGRGGMGAILDVWDPDLRRHLAMKVALGASSGSSATTDELDPRLLARFLEEAQVTGQLEHPGIVPVHELGLDADGQVFFTMRRVQGRDLEHVYAQVAAGEDGWSVTRAVGVLRKISEAMAYAHSKGVVHRDLKPANVMVGRFGEVYVMDWGLVRVRGKPDRHDVRVTDSAGLADAGIEIDRRQDGSGESGDALYTMDGDVLGTPAYMPPEQARGDLDRLDARSDVYSLGAMLYRLLAGVVPYGDGGHTSAHTLLEALREGEPTALGSLAPDAPAELVAIAEKAMARKPEDRYLDMADLGEDLSAYLEQRVVRAYETGAVAEARKWVRRNRPLAASLAAGVLALAGGLGFSLVEKGRADTNAALAETRRVEAENSAEAATAAAALAEERRALADASAREAALNADRAEAAAALAEERRLQADENAAEALRQSRLAGEVNRFLNEDLLGSVDASERGLHLTVREILLAGSERLDGRFDDEPLIEAELRQTFTRAFMTVGDYDAALPQVERAYALRLAELGDRDVLTLSARAALASVLIDVARYDEAVEHLDVIIPVSEERLGSDHSDTLLRTRLKGLALLRAARLDEAREVLESVRAREVNGLVITEASLTTAVNLGAVYTQLGRFEEAEGELRRTLSLQRMFNGDDHVKTYSAMTALSVLLAQTGGYAEAEALEEESYAGLVELLGPDHLACGQSLINLAGIDMRMQRHERAIERLVEGLRILRLSLEPDHDRVLRGVDVLATALDDVGRLEEAVALRTETLATMRTALGDEHPITLTALSNQALNLMRMGRLDEARTAHEELLEVQRAVNGPDHPSTLITLENYGNVLYSLRDYAGAVRTVEEVLAGRKRALGADHPDVAKTCFNLGMVRRYSGQLASAREAFVDAAAIYAGSIGLENPLGAECLVQLGDMAREFDDHEAAAEHYARALAIFEPNVPGHVRVGQMLHQLGLTARDLGAHVEALGYAERAMNQRRTHLGADHDDTFVSQYLLVLCLVDLEQWELAEEQALDYHARRLAGFGAHDEGTVAVRRVLVDIYEALGQSEQADDWR